MASAIRSRSSYNNVVESTPPLRINTESFMLQKYKKKMNYAQFFMIYFVPLQPT